MVLPIVFTCPFRSYIHSILAVANILAHNNIAIRYYVQENSLLLKSNVASDGQINILGGTICFAIDGTLQINDLTLF